MAKRRCIAIDVFQSDEFLNLSDESKTLYTAFILNCDDDGFVVNPRTVLRLYEKGEQQINELIDNGFLIIVDGLYVIKHWCIHNKLPSQKRKDTIYQSAFSKIFKNEFLEYEFKTDDNINSYQQLSKG